MNSNDSDFVVTIAMACPPDYEGPPWIEAIELHFDTYQEGQQFISTLQHFAIASCTTPTPPQLRRRFRQILK